MSRAEPHVCVISSGRPTNVVTMNVAMRGLPPATWYVPLGQGEAYQAFGAAGVREIDGGLVDQRNAALEDAFDGGQACLQLDDDFERIRVLEHPTDLRPRPATLRQAVDIIQDELLRSEAQLAGASATDNAYFVRRAVSRRHFIIASMMLVAPSEPRFDPQFRLKEDYDFTAQHLARYGEVCRVDRVLPTFRHYDNRGGCQLYRGAEAEAEAVERLKAKWPGRFFDNPRRVNEVLLQWDRRDGRKKGAEP